MIMNGYNDQILTLLKIRYGQMFPAAAINAKLVPKEESLRGLIYDLQDLNVPVRYQ
jgi:hypothetical protein